VSEAEKELFPPEGVDLERPSVARVYDWYLGGTANWAIDREFGKKALSAFPFARPGAIANRLFLNRAVRHLARLGVRQFVDIGSGIPTMGNTHQVADEVAPDSRVVYIDHEPVAVAHSQVLLEQHGDLARHAVINADLRDPDRLWQRVIETGVIDLGEPIALLLIAVLHFHQPSLDGVDVGPRAVARYRQLLPSGSYLAISHAANDGLPERVEAAIIELQRIYKTSSSSSWLLRSRQEIQALFGDFELVEPGMCWTPSWHPEESSPTAPVITFDTPNEAGVWAGVGRKP
jgi:hypothetical protein